jgi:pimeloyl-ACP methyl ester carboxylesterase
MRGTARTPLEAPAGLEALVERYDPDALHLPRGRARVRLAVVGGDAFDALLDARGARLRPLSGEPDSVLMAEGATWGRIAADVRAAMTAFRRRRLLVRRDLHVGVGFLAATTGADEPGSLRFRSVPTTIGELSVAEAGVGEPVVAIHGLGGTKVSFMSTIAALAPRGYRVIALDLPGSGESVKPIAAPYDAPYFTLSVTALLDALDLERAHLIGNSMGGRVAIEVGLRAPERVRRLVLLSPALAWLRERPFAPLLRLLRPELGLLQPAPRSIVEGIVRWLVPGATDGWTAAGVDEFLRGYLTPRGRAAFYAAARNIYLDEPFGELGFWTRLAGLSPDALFVWGREDRLVPIGFRRHVQRALPAARHVELDCGHVPQMEAPRETHAAILEFFRSRA